jgi:hypothetical protein
MFVLETVPVTGSACCIADNYGIILVCNMFIEVLSAANGQMYEGLVMYF